MILVLISLILDGIVSVYTNNTILIPLFTLTSLVYIYKYYEKNGMNKKEIIKIIAKNNNVKKDEIYKKFINN